MSLFKFFLIGSKSAARPTGAILTPDGDPLQHPDLEIMSLTELADLPLMPANLGRRAADVKQAKRAPSRQPHG